MPRKCRRDVDILFTAYFVELSDLDDSDLDADLESELDSDFVELSVLLFDSELVDFAPFESDFESVFDSLLPSLLPSGFSPLLPSPFGPAPDLA